MTAEVISGKEVAQHLRNQMKEEIKVLGKKQIKPHLTVILIGDHPASQSYVRGKERAASEINMSSNILKFESTMTEEDLLKEINRLNEDQSVHGILVQLPLPSHINEQHVIEAIDPQKDVDGFHPINIGKMLTNQDTFFPCTPYGIIKMLEYKNIDIEGKHAVVIGRSNIVGKPVGQLLLNKNATVTYCHSRTKNMKEITKQADILIVAVGKAHFVDEAFVKAGAAVIDVGINRTAEGKLTGDVHYDRVKEVASYITPVPGGVGPMTITMLLHNTIKACKRLHHV